MPSFTTTIDGHPITWNLVINLGHVAQIQGVYPDFRLERVLLAGDPTFERLTYEAPLLSCVLQVLLADQLRLRSITPEQLLASISGAAVDDAVKALIEAIGFFSPTRPGRERARLMVETLEALRKLSEQEPTSSGDSSGIAPPAPESSPGGTASGS